MTTISEIEQFLTDFKQKLDVFDIIFLNRTKNFEALLILGITGEQRLDHIRSIETANFSSGPNKDTNNTNMPDYWVFGKNLNNREIYIKINMGTTSNPVICMSFHESEYSMDYPLL